MVQERSYYLPIFAGVETRLTPRAASTTPVVGGHLLAETIEGVPVSDDHTLTALVLHKLDWKQ